MKSETQLGFSIRTIGNIIIYIANTSFFRLLHLVPEILVGTFQGCRTIRGYMGPKVVCVGSSKVPLFLVLCQIYFVHLFLHYLFCLVSAGLGIGRT
jgi:hypothetical protein